MKKLLNILGILELVAVTAIIAYTVGLCDERTDYEAERLHTSRYRYMTVTAYCACEKCCGKWADGVTASGHVIKQGEKFCAAPPDIPFGTVINIPGYGKVPVRDRGGAITGDRLDVYFNRHEDALHWGVRILEVNIENK